MLGQPLYLTKRTVFCLHLSLFSPLCLHTKWLKTLFYTLISLCQVHSFFIGHSYSDRKIRVFPYASSGEYDDRYDLMSTANAYMYHSNFGMSGPGLNGPHLDYLGWLPMDRMLYFGRESGNNYTLRLSSISVPHNQTRGWLLIMLPYDRDDPNNYYTIELRTPHNFDRGIEQPSVLVHRVQKNGISYYSTLLRQADFYELTDEGTEWVTFLELMSSTTSDSITNKGKQNSSSRNFQFIRVSLKKVYEYDADIHIISTFNPIDGMPFWRTKVLFFSAVTPIPCRIRPHLLGRYNE